MDFSNHTTKTLVDLYNESARLLGETEVNKFADRPTAEKRTAAIYERAKAKRAENAKATAGAQVEAATEMKGHVRAKDAPHPAIVSITSVSGKALEAEQAKSNTPAPVPAPEPAPAPTAPVEGDKPEDEKPEPTPLTTKDNTPTPDVKPALPLASADTVKDAQMPALRKVVRPVNTAPKTRIFARKEGTKQAALVDLLSREQGATFGELYDGLKLCPGKPWTGVSIRSGLAWDVNNICGYGVASEAFNGEEFAKQGRTYEAHRLGFGTPAYDPAYKLLVYRLTYPKGMTAPVPHIARPEKPTPAQKAAADAALKGALADAKAGKA